MQDRQVEPVDPQRDIVSARVLAHPASVVFAAYADARQLSRWWGPKDYTSTFHEFDLSPGGRWRLTLHGPDGTDHVNESVFLEVVAPRRIVFRHLSAPEFRMTITLADVADGTRMTWRMEFGDARLCERMRRIVVPANEENFDRLEALLAELHPARRKRRPPR